MAKRLAARLNHLLEFVIPEDDPSHMSTRQAESDRQYRRRVSEGQPVKQGGTNTPYQCSSCGKPITNVQRITQSGLGWRHVTCDGRRIP